MSTTIKIGGSEYPLAGAPETAGGTTSIAVIASESLTPEAVYSAIHGASSYIISTDGVDASAVDNAVFASTIVYDGITITFQSRKKSADEIQREQMQAQIDALGAQVVALTLGGTAS